MLDCVNGLSEALKTLGDPVRLRILKELIKSPVEKKDICVQELASKLDVSQPNVSHHLRILKMMGFIACDRDHRFAYYSVNRDKVEEVLSEVRTYLG